MYMYVFICILYIGAAGRGFSSWYGAGPLRFVRQRRMWRGMASSFLLVSLSLRFVMLLAAVADVRAVWKGGGGSGLERELVQVGVACDVCSYIAQAATPTCLCRSVSRLGSGGETTEPL